VIDLAAISNDPSGELFQEATWAINQRARVRAAQLAKRAGVSRYILPSSCSVYGFQDADTVSDEESPTNPLTTYAKANLGAEKGVLELADDSFTAVVIRQATVYGLSPRMRFDLAINGMTYGALEDGQAPTDERRIAVAADGPREGHIVGHGLPADRRERPS
jgi:nucleoside-diphosphate-sugar epimerase